ncbi:unnamed protein product, partial [Porites evermanni]
ETITTVSINEEDAKLWLLPLSFRLQEFADCLFLRVKKKVYRNLVSLTCFECDQKRYSKFHSLWLLTSKQSHLNGILATEAHWSSSISIVLV